MTGDSVGVDQPERETEEEAHEISRQRAAGQAHGDSERDRGEGVILRGLEMSDGKDRSCRGGERRADGGNGARHESTDRYRSRAPPPGAIIWSVSDVQSALSGS
ncbi:MAG TPA: hypothetical protein VD789_01930 [Thermomicrobiales bacterium]|nr:hypothetical protein [Thermomicrobiales bacterium]